MIIQRRIFFLAALIVTVLLPGCAGLQKAADQVAEAERLLASGEYLEAAHAFNELAGDAKGARKTEFLLRATAALARADRIHNSRQILQTLQMDPKNPRHRFLRNLAEAHIALKERRAKEVLDMLEKAPRTKMDTAYLADYHDLRADAYTMLGNRVETASELVKRERYLSDQALIEANQHDIWKSLAMMTERALAQMRMASARDEFSGWLELVRITKAYQLDPKALNQRVSEWRKSYPKHPVLPDILKGLLERRQEDIIIPRKIAVLLPFDSRFAKAAEAVRDGFIAAYYSRRHNVEQHIQVYDSGSDPETALAAYQRALNEGAEFVVGPLSKESIDIIADEGSLPVPTLALNYGREENIPYNLYQFGLSPEEEARQVAERTWLDGHVNAAALIPAGPWGERVYETFRQRWEQVGGKIVEVQQYQPAEQDFSTPIKTLLNIDESRRRAQNMGLLLNRKIEFQPRRRQDVDFIFLAAYPQQARQIRPQLKFYHASDVPVYATSHVFTGNLNQERDRDMDGLMFGDMPWVLAGSTTHRGLRPEIEQQISRAGNSLQRLYALGIDAYNIIAALTTLKAYPYERYDGETGSLSLDSKQRVKRQLTWVKFRSGRPVALDEGMQ